jgi:hypothetical protein
MSINECFTEFGKKEDDPKQEEVRGLGLALSI